MTTERRSAAALLLAGSLVVVASLQLPWAVDGPRPGTVPSRIGWEWMGIGDVLLTALALLAALLAIGLVRGRPAGRRAMGLAAGSLLVLCVVAVGGVLMVRFLTGLAFIMDENDPLPPDADGAGSWVALAGLFVVLAGSGAALVGALGPGRPQPPRPPHPHVAPVRWG